MPGSLSETVHKNNGFWYTRKQLAIFVVGLFVVVRTLSLLIPPFQSPDEFDHIKRAYLLSKGEILVLEQSEGATGAQIDTGLLDYMDYYGPASGAYENKIDMSLLRRSNAIRWTSKTHFSELLSTAAYFPLLYLPQAAACLVGRTLDLPISNTYFLARTLSLVCALTFLWLAASIYPMPPAVAAVFLTPMSLLQLASASQDAVTFGFSAFAAAYALRSMERHTELRPSSLALVSASLVLLAISRIYLLPLTLIPLAIKTKRPRRLNWVLAATGLAVSAAWILFAAITNRGNSGALGASAGQIALYYATHITDLARVFIRTILDPGIIAEYWDGFVGVLGWSDTPLDSGVYVSFLLLFAFLLSLSFQRPTNGRRLRMTMVFSSVCCLVLLYWIALIAWTPHPAIVVLSIQSRYFTPVLIFIGFAVLSGNSHSDIGRSAVLVLSAMVALSMWSMSPKLLARYWIEDAAPISQETAPFH